MKNRTTKSWVVIAKEINGMGHSCISAHATRDAAKAASRAATDNSGYGYFAVKNYRITESLMASDLCRATNTKG